MLKNSHTATIEAYRDAWALTSLKQKQDIYEAMRQLPGGNYKVSRIMADQAGVER